MTSATCSTGFSSSCWWWSVVSMITSWAPTPSIRVKRPTFVRSVLPSMRRAGNLLDTTRTVHPGVLGAVPGARIAKISGGVCASLPSQNGQRSLSLASTASCLKSVGRAARSVAMMTQRREIGSLRNSGTEAPPRKIEPCGILLYPLPADGLGERPVVERVVLAGGRGPGEVGRHARLLDPTPGMGGPEGLQCPAQGLQHRRRVIGDKDKSVGGARGQRIWRGVDDRVGQPSGVADDRHRAIAEAVELVQSRGLVARRHEEEIGPSLDAMRQGGVKTEPDPRSLWVPARKV